MARTRSIKPGFFDNEILGCLPPLTRLLFIGLWCQADREGRLEDRPRKLKKTILGYDDVSTDDVDAMLSALDESGFIIRYQAGEQQYIQVVNFVKHQNPHMKEKPSEIPPPPGQAQGTTETGTVQEPGREETPPVQAPGKHQAVDGKAEEVPGADAPPPGKGADDPGEEEPPEGDGKQEAKKTAMERRFELFWAAYPKKKAKKAAWEAFKKVNPDEELFKRIMEAIGRARTSQEWLKDGGQYIPHPATWLNGGCWDDEEFKGVKADGADRQHFAPGSERPVAPQPGAATPGFKRADTGD